MGAKSWLIKGLDSQAKMIEVSTFWAGCSGSNTSKPSGNTDQVNHRRACPKMHQTQVIAAPLHRAADYRFIEGDAASKIRDSENNVVNAVNGEGLQVTLDVRRTVPVATPNVRGNPDRGGRHCKPGTR